MIKIHVDRRLVELAFEFFHMYYHSCVFSQLALQTLLGFFFLAVFSAIGGGGCGMFYSTFIKLSTFSKY
jgi:hypothetical protein